MSGWSALLLFSAMLLLMAFRVPVWAAMFIPGAAGYVVLSGSDAWLAFLKGMAFARFSIYDLSVIPLFLLMGQLATLAWRSRAGVRHRQRGVRVRLRLVRGYGGYHRAGRVARNAPLWL
jgi:hypothetical protein